MNNTAKTAMTRTKESTPVAFLFKKKLMKGSILDYGCGKGKDLEFLSQHFIDVAGWDPNHKPDMHVLERYYDTITCNFVLNVIEDPNQRQQILQHIESLLNPGGIAYIAVRNDKKNLKGTTSIGTWQGFIELDLPIITKNSSFVMYALTSQKVHHNPL